MHKSKMLLICCLLLVLSLSHAYTRDIVAVFCNPPDKKIIVIDAGHGGNDPGKVSNDGIQEKDINLSIAKYLKDYLCAQDYVVYITRNDDKGLHDEGASNKKSSDMKNRIAFFNEKNADLVISIHQNSYPDSFQHGAQTFYYANSGESKRLATHIQNSLLKIDTSNTRKEKASDSYYILKKSSMPAVIVECGFLSNPEETAKLSDSNYQKKLAYAISLGVSAYDKTQ